MALILAVGVWEPAVKGIVANDLLARPLCLRGEKSLTLGNGLFSGCNLQVLRLIRRDFSGRRNFWG